MIKIKTSSPIFLFAILTTLVIFSQILFLQPVIGQGLTNEDYIGLFKARLFRDKIFSDPVYFWNTSSLHNASHNFYIAFLDLLFGKNYDMYLYTGIFLKILATLSLYPLILLISKNKLLAFLTTFLYGICYPSAGALRLYVVENEYLGVALMNLSLIIYFFCVKKINFWLLLLSSFSTTLSFLAAPVRTFPVFAIVLLIELVILIKNKFSKSLYSILRIISIFLPTTIITILSLGTNGAGSYSLAGIPDFLKRVSDGNWYLLLNPLWGLGYTFLPIRYMIQIFGVLNIYKYSFSTYLGFLLQTPFIIFTLTSLTLSYFLSKKRIRFFFILMFINLIFDVLLYIIFSHHLSIPANLVREGGFDSFHGLYTNILANYIISIAITCLIEWYLTGRKNVFLFLTFLSPFISLFFIISQWIFTRDYYTYSEGIHRYFVIPAIGSYLFISCLIVMIYQKRKIRSVFANLLIIFLVFSIIGISKDEVFRIFTGEKIAGVDLQLQQSMKDQTLSYIPKDKINEDLLIYIKFKSEKLADSNYWENVFDWRDLIYWMFLERGYLTNKGLEGCIAVTWDVNDLHNMAKKQRNIKGFLFNKLRDHNEGICTSYIGGSSATGKFLPLDNFYAFSIDGPKVINITEEVKKALSNYE